MHDQTATPIKSPGRPNGHIPTWILVIGMLVAAGVLIACAAQQWINRSDSAFTTVGALVALAAFVPLTGLLYRANDRRTAAEAAYRPEAIASLQIDHGDGDYYLTPGFNRVIGIGWAKRVFVVGNKLDEVEAIPFSGVKSATIEVDGATVTSTISTTKTNRGSQLGGAVAGGLLLGPAGLVIGGLSGSSRTRGRSSETRFVKSVTLVVRVADRATPLHRIDFMSALSGKVDAPNVKEAAAKAAHYHALLTQIIEEGASDKAGPDGASRDVGGQIDRLWTLHEKGALTRAEYDDQKTALLSASSRAVIATVGAFLATLISPSAARAYDLGHLMRGTPELQLTTTKPIDAVEQCIIMQDLPGMPIVYRYPTKPGSLIHGGREARPLFAFELIPAGDHLNITVWQGKGERPKLESCL